MYHHQAKRVLWVGVVLCFVAVLLPAASSAQRSSEAAAPASVSRSFHFTYNGKPPLLNSVKKTLKGDKRKDGGCTWHPADMTLAPQDKALEQRQISVDNANCTTVVEIGNPASIDTLDGEELASQAGPQAGPARAGASYSPRGRRLSAAATNVASKAWYKVTWYDVVGLELNHVRPILAWTWNGSCVVASTSDVGTFWQSATGWSRTSLNWWRTTSCSDHRTHADADFKNSIFCFPPSTYTHYRNVRIRGGGNGTYGAALDSTWTDGTQCAPLHWSGQVVKEF